MTFVDTCDRRDDLTRRAVATLEGVVFSERELHRVQVTYRIGQPFNRDDFRAINGHRQNQAGVSASTVKQHSTSTAIRFVEL